MILTTKNTYNIYSYSIFFIYLSYILIFFGISIININYIHYFLICVHILLCIFLFKRFNIFNNETLQIDKYEKRFIFSVAIILLINTLVYEVGIFHHLKFKIPF